MIKNYSGTLFRQLSLFAGISFLSSAGLQVSAQQYALKAWGLDVRGELGIGNTVFSEMYLKDTVADIGAEWGGRFIQITTQAKVSMGVKENGSLWGWGENSSSNPIVPGVTGHIKYPAVIDSGHNGRWRQVSAGFGHRVALKEDGTVWTWGVNGRGQTGNGSSSGTVTRPTSINIGPAGLKAVYVATYGGEVVFAQDGRGSMALMEDGTVYMWGSNLTGAKADGTNANVAVPTPVVVQMENGDTLKAAKLRAAGYGTIFAITADSVLYGWGGNTQRQLGYGNNTNQNRVRLIPVTGKVIDVSVNKYGSYLIKADGSLWVTGSSSNLNLGGAALSDVSSFIELDNGQNGRWVKVFARGEGGGWAVKENGELWGWGLVGYGMLGHGNDTAHYEVPTLSPIGSLVETESVMISAVSEHSLAIGNWKVACEAPAVRLDSIFNTADLSWNAVPWAEGYDIAIDQSPTLEPQAAPAHLTDTVYNSGNILTALEKYYVHIRTHCGYGNYSDWDTLSFVAPYICRAPREIYTQDISAGSALVYWLGLDSAQNYEIAIDQTADLAPSVSAQTVSDTFFNAAQLDPATRYYAHIRTECKDGTYSDWDTVSFVTLPECKLPELVTVSDLGLDEATVTWTSVDLAEEYEFAIDRSATLEPTGLIQNLTDTVYQTGAVLSENTLYYVHIRSLCPMSNYSDWDTVSFTTLKKEEEEDTTTTRISLAEAEGRGVYLYPNPVSGLLHISQPHLFEKAVIWSVDGKEMLAVTTLNAGIQVDQLPEGLYSIGLVRKSDGTMDRLKFLKAAR